MQIPFVQFLLSRGEINGNTAERIDRWAQRNREPIGMIAVDHGLIIGRQIDEVLERQENSSRKFGELAVQLRFMTAEKVERLLPIQQFRVLSAIVEALSLCGAIPLHEGIQLVAEFAREHPEDCFDHCVAIGAA